MSNLGLTKSHFWINFNVKNISSNELYYLEFAYPFHNQLDVYLPDSNGKYIKNQVGDHFEFDNREIKHMNFLFELSLKRNETKTIYGFIKCNGEATSLPIQVLTPIRLRQKNYEEQTFLGLYYGILIFA